MTKPKLPLRLRYCPKCGIVTVGREQAPCFGIVMKFRHNKTMTKFVPVLPIKVRYLDCMADIQKYMSGRSK